MSEEYMNGIRPIRTEEDYEDRLKQIDLIFDAEPNTPEGDLLEVLVILVEDYERTHYPISKEEILQKKLEMAMEALKGISSLWHGRGLAPKVLEELDKTITEIEETK